MKLFHLADLHIGKSVKEFSMLAGQDHVLGQVCALVREEKPDAVLICGDVYDRQIPSAGAVELYDEFLTQLVELGVPVLVISGNHDSPERLAFAGRIMEKSGVHVAGVFDGAAHVVTLEDAHGPVDFHLLPFVKPAAVRRFFPDDELETHEDAVRAALAARPLRPGVRSVLLAHQFVVAAGTDPERSESETEPVGGVNAVDAALFDAFDYVALGHLHRPQAMGRPAVRYAGSPLKYSFSEAEHQKGVCVVELSEKGEVCVERLPLAPLHDMRKIRGPFAELLRDEVVRAADPEDYLQITLTDEQEPPEAWARLRRVYPNAMELLFDNARTRAAAAMEPDEALDAKPPAELFADFFFEQNGRGQTGAQRVLVSSLLETEGDG